MFLDAYMYNVLIMVNDHNYQNVLDYALLCTKLYTNPYPDVYLSVLLLAYQKDINILDIIGISKKVIILPNTTH